MLLIEHRQRANSVDNGSFSIFYFLFSIWQTAMPPKKMYCCVMILFLVISSAVMAICDQEAPGGFLNKPEDVARQVLINLGYNNPDELEGNIVVHAIQVSEEAGRLLAGNRELLTSLNFLFFYTKVYASYLAGLVSHFSVLNEEYSGHALILDSLAQAGQQAYTVLPLLPPAKTEECPFTKPFNFSLNEMCTPDERPLEIQEEHLPELPGRSVVFMIAPELETDDDGSEKPEITPELEITPTIASEFELQKQKNSISGIRIPPTPTVLAHQKGWVRLAKDTVVGAVFLAANIPCVMYEVSRWTDRNGKKARKKKTINKGENKQRVILWTMCATGGGVLAAITDASLESLPFLFRANQSVKSAKRKQKKYQKSLVVESDANFIMRNTNRGLLGFSCELEVTTVYSSSVLFINMAEIDVPVPSVLSGILATAYYPFCKVHTEFDSNDVCTYVGIGIYFLSMFTTNKEDPELIFTFYSPIVASTMAFAASTLCRGIRFINTEYFDKE